MVVQDWYRTVFQTKDPDPYPLTNGGQTRGPVHAISVAFIHELLASWRVFDE